MNRKYRILVTGQLIARAGIEIMQFKSLYYKPKEYGSTIFKGGKLIISD